jgi:hypothetical protein
MRAPIMWVSIAIAGCGDDGAGPIDGPIDADDGTPDARVDAPPGTSLVGGNALGVRQPIMLRLAAGGEQVVAIVVDGIFEFATPVAENTPYSVTIDGTPPCVLENASGTVGTGDVVIDLICDGVVELSAVDFSVPVTLTPPFDPAQSAYAVARPLLLDPPDTYTVTPTASFPAIAAIEVNGTAVISGQPSPALIDADPGDDVTIVTRHPMYPSLTRTYGFALAPGALAQDELLKATPTLPNVELGYSIAIDGDTIVTGARYDDAGGIDAGAAYVFRRNGTTWAQETKLQAPTVVAGAQFGFAVSIAGDTIVVGEPVVGAGAAHVFVRSGTTWSFQATLLASNPDPGDRFGTSVGIAGDRVVVGAPFEDSNATTIDGNQASNAAPDAGAAYAFERVITTWSQTAYLKASNAESPSGLGDGFGSAVAISGSTVAVSAPFEDSAANGVGGSQASNAANDAGAVYVFFHDGASWSQQAYVKASASEADDWFGKSVAVHGDTLAAGATRDDVGGATDTGSATVYVRSGVVWSHQADLLATNRGAFDELGESIAISDDHVVVGSHREDGSSPGVDGPDNNGAADAGAAYLFRRVGTSWSQQAYIKASNPAILDRFGFGVAVDADTIAVGAHGENTGGADAGAAYVFR